MIRYEISFCSLKGEANRLVREEASLYSMVEDVSCWSLEETVIRRNISFCSIEGEVIPLVEVEASVCSMVEEVGPLGL